MCGGIFRALGYAPHPTANQFFAASQMPDPFANIKTLDDAGLTESTAFEDALIEPFDQVPDFDPEADPEVDVNATLAEPHLHRRVATRRLFADYRADPEALKHLEALPREGESLHAVMGQRYSMWDLVPALIERTGRRITDLHIATLSYSTKTAADLIGLIDDGRINRCSLIVSFYFKAQNRGLYDALVLPLRERKQRVIACRNHCKVLLVKIAGGGSYVCEGSANLRSNKNCEQFVLTRDRRLYQFHREWMEQLLNREGGTDAK